MTRNEAILAQAMAAVAEADSLQAAKTICADALGKIECSEGQQPDDMRRRVRTVVGHTAEFPGFTVRMTCGHSTRTPGARKHGIETPPKTVRCFECEKLDPPRFIRYEGPRYKYGAKPQP